MTTPKIDPKAPHCESCGSTDYEDLNCGDQGYTACCNEIACGGIGWGTSRFGNDSVSVEACCWAVAEQVYAERGIPVPAESWRLA